MGTVVVDWEAPLGFPMQPTVSCHREARYTASRLPRSARRAGVAMKTWILLCLPVAFGGVPTQVRSANRSAGGG